MVTNSIMHTTFFNSIRNASWNAIKELGDRLKCRMLNTQNVLKEEKKHTQELEATNQRLREDIIDLAMESCDQDRQIASRDALDSKVSLVLHNLSIKTWKLSRISSSQFLS